MAASKVIPSSLFPLDTWDSLEDHDLATAVLEVADCLVIVLDRFGRVVRFNASCQRLTGYRLEAVQGRVFWDLLLPEEQIAGVREAFDDLSHSRIPNLFENEWLTTRDERRLIAWSNTMLENDSGEVDSSSARDWTAPSVAMYRAKGLEAVSNASRWR
jgi:PAS domain S-box-containing protein